MEKKYEINFKIVFLKKGGKNKRAEKIFGKEKKKERKRRIREKEKKR
ncbi:hypothetical protein [Clostridium sp. ZBS15]|nr:hypothetical protein [Clostridium sp. ZBS15]